MLRSYLNSSQLRPKNPYLYRGLCPAHVPADLMGVVRQWIVRPVIPVLQSLLTRSDVSSGVSRRRILTDIPIACGLPTSSTRAFRMLANRSGVRRRAAPMPPSVENDLGHPAFTSKPLTCSAKSFAASTARSGEFVPI